MNTPVKPAQVISDADYGPTVSSSVLLSVYEKARTYTEARRLRTEASRQHKWHAFYAAEIVEQEALDALYREFYPTEERRP